MHNQTNESTELKKEFQIERLILFSDAVFAIALTLLVIEIKAPHVHAGATDSEIINQLSELIPKFVGFLVSFFVVGIYWRAHHRLFGYVKNYNDSLIWLNLLFLLTIVIMPFSSAYYSENYEHNFPFAFYCLNVVATGVTNYLLLRYVSNPKNGISEGFQDPLFKRYVVARTITVPLIFFSAILIAYYISVPWSRMCPMLVLISIQLINWRYKKQTAKLNALTSSVKKRTAKK